MEFISFGVVALIIGVIWYVGLFDSVETGARMANRKVERYEAEQISDDIRYYTSKEGSISDADYEKAVAVKNKYNKFRDL